MWHFYQRISEPETKIKLLISTMNWYSFICHAILMSQDKSENKNMIY